MNYNSPKTLWGDLFVDLHLSGLWKDGKMISDAGPKFELSEILSAYAEQKLASDFDLKVFFEKHFEYSQLEDSGFTTDLSNSPEQHITALWKVLSRTKDESILGSSLVPLPFPYVVPGGRFNEIYYWDSYFTQLGLWLDGQGELCKNMLDNFAWLIDEFGFIPNGNRTYFLSRSQPPFFSLMVQLLGNYEGQKAMLPYLPQLVKEYKFWNADRLGHVISIDDGTLNRYFDQNPEAREEMYADDFNLAKESNFPSDLLFSNLKAACESGWDFSSRWLKDESDLGSIQTTDLLPIDLNCLLYNLETLIAELSTLKRESEQAKTYSALAKKRAKLINNYFWNDELTFYTDFNFKINKCEDALHLGAVYPLFFNLASEVQAKSVASIIRDHFLKAGGVVTTTINSGQQWDAPNGWAPLQWMTVIGLANYGFKDLALDISQRWLSLNTKVYNSTGQFVEKYNVVNLNLEAGGGEYKLQDGFGWSNGVYLALKDFIKRS